MRPVRIVTAVAFAAAIAVTGCAAHSTAADPSAVPAAPVAAAPASPGPQLPVRVPEQPAGVSKVPAPAPAPKPPVLADGRYDAYIREVNTRGDYLVVDLVQVFEGDAAVDAAVADGQSRETAQVLYTYIRNQNPRLRTLPMAADLRLDLRGIDCAAPASHQLAKLAADAKAMSGPQHTYYFTLTVAGGAVHRVQEFVAINAC
jgi:hypothetical protein